VALVLAVSGRFAALAAVSAVSRLLVYIATAAATLRLRSARFERQVGPAVFVAPFGPLVPLLAIAVSLAFLAGATPGQLRAGAIALASGAALYVFTLYLSPHARAAAPRTEV
jgi:amino acid transporter